MSHTRSHALTCDLQSFVRAGRGNAKDSISSIAVAGSMLHVFVAPKITLPFFLIDIFLIVELGGPCVAIVVTNL